MMFFLITNVVYNPRNIRFGKCKSAISALPLEEFIWRDFVSYQMRGSPFNLFK